MKIIPLASESLGVRSLSVYIEAKNRILIDPGVALGPKRYSLPPAKIEIEKLEAAKKKIIEFLGMADTIIISHYHYDHYLPSANYNGKHLLLKDPRKKINKSQMSRASKFLKGKENYEYVDGKNFTINDCRMEFSPPLPHGEEGTRLGFVIMTMIEDKKRIIHASDTQLLNKKSIEWIIEKMPDLIITSSPPTYIGYIKNAWKTGTKNINKIILETDSEIILDHHIIRDKRYPEFFKGLEKEPSTFARYLKVEETPLEAYRRELHEIENGKKVKLPFKLP
ncbi:MAG TPA: MBL fold metallo-hydrolase [Methanothermobacter sp.]|nr:predicted hydrolase of the metallo-beta-lactamase superfamily [Methanothermobacter sp. MT-2]HHW04638.1 hypothetical protein [Methanothermobacter sp.]HOK72103.1 MBL fold metallo-hydrolase [Methanothermobacter sp.]HOL68416.1 MBL fold metallo-hydrolase [Methanothermobacter sp.]HPQ04174.1 MBL fold metallo-hydrolase [Methanothermobacter sp.]